jgi:hypothetical protein
MVSIDLGLRAHPLGFPWHTRDPFLFCVHHLDAYPRGNDVLGPRASLAGRNLGMDFEGIDGWRMYHGAEVPGFPQHPHRGFETVTLARRGFIDHSDSLGAAARFGHGDVQWMTAGRGIVHSEMFPLVDPDNPNPVELFQIWLNLPRSDKMVPAHFSMLWSHTIPRRVILDGNGNETEVVVVAGSFEDAQAPGPPPASWASRSDADVAIWTLRMEPNAIFVLPAARERGVNRSLYFFEGERLFVGGHPFDVGTAIDFGTAGEATLLNGGAPAELLMLQGRPIAEPVSHYGPFVMNEPHEIRTAISDYQRTRFGDWPWPSDEPVHDRDSLRFARHADGRLERGGGDEALDDAGAAMPALPGYGS